NSPERPELHARLLDFYATSGESEAVIKKGKEFLAVFPNSAKRTDVALLVADAYARTKRSSDEFAIYDSVLSELASRANGVPLGLKEPESQLDDARPELSGQPTAEEQAEPGHAPAAGYAPGAKALNSSAFRLSAAAVETQAGARSPEYARVL